MQKLNILESILPLKCRSINFNLRSAATHTQLPDPFGYFSLQLNPRCQEKVDWATTIRSIKWERAEELAKANRFKGRIKGREPERNITDIMMLKRQLLR